MPNPRVDGGKRAVGAKAKRQAKQAARCVKPMVSKARRSAEPRVRRVSGYVPASLPPWGVWADDEGHLSGTFSSFDSYEPGYLPPWGEWDSAQPGKAEVMRLRASGASS